MRHYHSKSNRQVTGHYRYERNKREDVIFAMGGEGKVVASFHVDRNHADGPEVHKITSKAIIIVYNEYTGKMVTKLIARPGQIKRYYLERGLVPPEDLVLLAKQHELAGLNMV